MTLKKMTLKKQMFMLAREFEALSKEYEQQAEDAVSIYFVERYKGKAEAFASAARKLKEIITKYPNQEFEIISAVGICPVCFEVVWADEEAVKDGVKVYHIDCWENVVLKP